VAEITEQVCDGMFIASAAMVLKDRQGVSGPSNVVSFIRHIAIGPVIQNAASELGSGEAG
jgi:hypothetical protein